MSKGQTEKKSTEQSFATALAELEQLFVDYRKELTSLVASAKHRSTDKETPQ